MKNLTQSPTQLLKARVKNARAEMKIAALTRKDLERWIYARRPEYNCPEGGSRFQNVWFGYAADIALTALIEDFVSEKTGENERSQAV